MSRWGKLGEVRIMKHNMMGSRGHEPTKIRYTFILLIACAVLILTSMVSGEIQSLPPIVQGSCIDLPQVCANCTFVNITTVKYPNLSISAQNIPMTKNGQNYNFTYCRTHVQGQYTVCTVGNPDAILTSACYDFEVTAIGDDLDLSSALIYMVLLIFAGLSFLIFSYAGIKIPFKDSRQDGLIKTFTNKAYFKIMSIGMAYLSALYIFYLLWGLSFSYLKSQTSGGIFQIWFYVMSYGLVIVVPILILLAIAVYTEKKRIDELIMRNLPHRPL